MTFDCRCMQDEFVACQENVLKFSVEKRRTGQQLDEGAVCEICLKTKFADGVGHSCHYCNKKSCARCGRRVTIKSVNQAEKGSNVGVFCFLLIIHSVGCLR